MTHCTVTAELRKKRQFSCLIAPLQEQQKEKEKVSKIKGQSFLLSTAHHMIVSKDKFSCHIKYRANFLFCFPPRCLTYRLQPNNKLFSLSVFRFPGCNQKNILTKAKSGNKNFFIIYFNVKQEVEIKKPSYRPGFHERKQ